MKDFPISALMISDVRSRLHLQFLKAAREKQSLGRWRKRASRAARRQGTHEYSIARKNFFGHARYR